MARIRSVKPGFFTTPDWLGVSLQARLVLIGLFTEADDAGRVLDSPKLLAGSLFPHDEPVTAARVDKWLIELEAAGKILRYVDPGPGVGRYLAIVNWSKHQRISHPTPSTFPPPPGEPPEPFRNGSGNPPELFRPEVEVEVERELERDLEVEVEGSPVDNPSLDPNGLAAALAVFDESGRRIDCGALLGEP